MTRKYMIKSLFTGLSCLIVLAAFVAYGCVNPKEGCGETRRAAAVAGEEGIVFRNGDETADKMAITCNVDWGEDEIPKILEILKEKKVHITFFVSGRWAENNPDMLRRMYLCGHDIQSHGYRHKLSTKISADEERAEIQKTEDAIVSVLGIKPTVYAPPSGDYDADTVSLCREMGYKLSLWSADTIDWKPGSTSDVIFQRIAKKPMKGAIVLMHPKPETVKALPKIIDAISEQNVEILPIRELLMV